MSREEKIRKLDRDIKESLRLCEREGLSKAEIRAVAAPVVGYHEKWRRRERLRTLMYMAVAVAVVAALYQNKVTSEFISAVAKIGMVKLVLPYWDWTTLHQRDCLFDNPYREPIGIVEEDCEPLVELTIVERVQEIDQDKMAEEFLFDTVPVIITDAMAEWRAFKELDFNHEFISKLYHEDPILSNTTVCRFSGSHHNLQDFLRMMSDTESFQAHWGHCKLEAAKVIRTFYKRPYFLPGMVEVDPVNYLVVGKHNSQYTLFEPNVMQSAWMSQVKGQFDFQLIPHEVCAEMCNTLEGTLAPGETLVYSMDLWELYYAAPGEGEAVAIISGGSWE